MANEPGEASKKLLQTCQSDNQSRKPKQRRKDHFGRQAKETIMQASFRIKGTFVLRGKRPERVAPMKASHMAGAVFRCSSLFILLVIGAVQVTPQTTPTAQASDKVILIKNTEVFDGVSNELHRGNVLIVGKNIKQISSAPMPAPPQATVIDAGGRVLMPGLTDAHWHMTMAASTLQDLNAADAGLMYANAVAEAKDTLMRGFTTVRDMAGPTFGLKAAIDAGTIPGPRVYPSGALVSQTSGHGDFAPAYAVPKVLAGTRSHTLRR